MPSIRREVTGNAADLANEYTENPIGGAEDGSNGKRYLKPAMGYYDDAEMQNGGPVPSMQPEGSPPEKGPANQTIGPKGTSRSGNGKGRF